MSHISDVSCSAYDEYQRNLGRRTRHYGFPYPRNEREAIAALDSLDERLYMAEQHSRHAPVAMTSPMYVTCTLDDGKPKPKTHYPDVIAVTNEQQILLVNAGK